MSWYSRFLGTHSGESGFGARSCPNLKSTCEATRHTLPLNRITDLSLPRIPTSDSASNTFTFALIPRDFLRRLFGKYGSDLPPKFDAPLSSGVLESLNASIRSNIDPSTISLISGLFSVPLVSFVSNTRTTAILSDDGVGVSLDSSIDESNPAGLWVIETVIIRFRITFTPYGLYPVHVSRKWSSDPEVGTAKFGYDAAVCLQKYEPWIIETYNTSMTSPSALRVVGKGDGSTLLSPSGNIRGTSLAGTRYLNTTNKLPTFFGALSNSVSRMSVVNSDVTSRYKPSGNVGPIAPPRTKFLLTLTYSTGTCFSQ